ncbi:DUF2787 family protein [Vibrio jasicida]|uniref:DUF2787 family protein n=1 Tax=Vibrio jasicida TaxID=766224 RepID=UPI00390B3E83
MSHSIVETIATSFKLSILHQVTDTLLKQYVIPANAKRISLNLKLSSFYLERAGLQPLELQLERDTPDSPWEIRFIASFDYPDEQAETVDVSLYFNFKYQWFYQPDIKQCELLRPEVITLFISWLNAFINHLQNDQFDTQTLTVISTFE